MMLPRRCLSVGQSDSPEFRPLWDRLQSWLPTATWDIAASASEFLERRNSPSTRAMDFAVIWQCWSDEYPPASIHQLLAALPLCRVVCVTGPWCEADQRTRRAWPPAVVVPWWRARVRFERELSTWQAGDGSAPPWTASREEVWLWEQADSPPPSDARVQIAPRPFDAAFAAMLANHLISRGYQIDNLWATGAQCPEPIQPGCRSDLLAGVISSGVGDDRLAVAFSHWPTVTQSGDNMSVAAALELRTF